ncbi:hypothetical protein F5148DRAFT_1308522 [Russula earlei]|uniref:Uncharacterized protein n=1 Tax=Russula earlei TaxID=71964 RepID=A0ACC0U795_9AGAM|nr:hypothetical protein F5148DRAFT_1308522 [Russula earlei]
MLARSPPLPLIIDHLDGDHDVSAEDEEGMTLALKHCDRVRRVRLDSREMPVSNLQSSSRPLTTSFRFWVASTSVLPSHQGEHELNDPQRDFEPPHLRHLVLRNFALPTGSSFLTTAIGVVTRSLRWIHPSADLETLGITFHSPVPSREVERRLREAQISTHVTFPNIRWFALKGASAYLDALLPWMAAPLLAKLHILFYNQLTFPLPHLLQFMSAAENLRFNTPRFTFYEGAIFVSEGKPGGIPCTCKPSADTSTGRLRLRDKFSTPSGQYSLPWNISISSTGDVLLCRSGTTKHTAHNGATF